MSAGTTKRSRGGRPRFEPTEERRRQAESLAGLGLTRLQIASVLGCNEDTLRKYFAAELASGDAKAAAKIAQSLFAAATSWMRVDPVTGTVSGSPERAAITAAIWWEKSRSGRSDRPAPATPPPGAGGADPKAGPNAPPTSDVADQRARGALARLESLLAGGDGGEAGVAGNGAAKAAPAA